MTELILKAGDVRTLLWHTALYGLAAILDAAGVSDVRVNWTTGMRPLPRITSPNLTSDLVDATVRDHTRVHTKDTSWVRRDIELAGKARGLMSPRHTVFRDATTWDNVRQARHRELDNLTDGHAWHDLRFLAALGEPCYWSRNSRGVPLQDDGASRLEMQPRNQGSEFVGTRLRKLAETVAARPQGAIITGIQGDTVVDEAGSDRIDSRTATGLANPGPIDNAVAWCALWGIAELPSAPRVNATAATTGHIGQSHDEWFYAPVWRSSWRPSRLRAMLAHRALRDAATAGLSDRWTCEPVDETSARAWLSARGVTGIVRFPIERFGSDNAPERRAMRGTPLSMAVR